MKQTGEKPAPRSGRAARRTLLSVVAVGLALLGCDDRTSAPAPAVAGKSGAADQGARRYRIGVSQANLGEPYRVQMNADLKAAADGHPGLDLVFKDAQNDSLRQRAQVEELLAEGIDLLVISPKESAPLTQPVARVYQQGIPVIVLDRRVDGERFTTFIGGDNERIGREAGRWIAETLGGKGRVVELQGLMTSSPARERHAGFLAGLAREKHPELEIVFTADTQWLEPNARREMESALAAHPHIDLVYAHNDPGAHGAYLAAKSAGRSEQMKFVGIDALPHEGQRYVREGLLDMSLLYPTCGKEAIEVALTIRDGGKPPRELTLGTRLFTRSNLESGGQAID